VWSLGITCIEMAHGKPPFHSVRPMLAMIMIPNKPPPTLDAGETLFIFIFTFIIFIFIFSFLLIIITMIYFFPFVKHLFKYFFFLLLRQDLFGRVQRLCDQVRDKRSQAKTDSRRNAGAPVSEKGTRCCASG